MDRRHGGTHLGPERSHQRRRRALQHGDIETTLASGGGDLEPDEAGADHDDPRSGALVERRPQRERVVERSQLEEAGQIWLAGQLPARRADGEDHAVRPQHRVIGERQAASAGIEGHRPHSEAEVELQLVERLRLAQGDAVGLPLAGEHLLGQRGTVVRCVRLGADQRDRAGEPFATQRLTRSEAGEGRSDDGDVVEVGHGIGACHARAQTTRAAASIPSLSVTTICSISASVMMNGQPIITASCTGPEPAG